MAKKDLFELLQVRHRTGGQPQPKTAPPRFASVRGWFDGLRAGRTQGKTQGKAQGKAQARRPSARAGGQKFALPIAGLAVIVLGTLVVGLLIGRGSAPSKDAKDLNARIEKPDWVPPGDFGGADDLPAEKEVETLSSTFFAVLAFRPSETPGMDRSRARRLAYFLRQQGVASARIKLVPLQPASDGHVWATVVYAQQDDASAVLQQLKNIDPPDFEPAYAKKVAQLEKLSTLKAN